MCACLANSKSRSVKLWGCCHKWQRNNTTAVQEVALNHNSQREATVRGLMKENNSDIYSEGIWCEEICSFFFFYIYTVHDT